MSKKQLAAALVVLGDLPGKGWKRAAVTSLGSTRSQFRWAPQRCNATLDNLTSMSAAGPGATKAAVAFQKGSGTVALQASETLVQTGDIVDIAGLTDKIANAVGACSTLTATPKGQAASAADTIRVTLTQPEVPPLGDGSTGVGISVKAAGLTIHLDLMLVADGNHLIVIQTASQTPQPTVQAQLASQALDRLDGVLKDA